MGVLPWRKPHPVGREAWKEKVHVGSGPWAGSSGISCLDLPLCLCLRGKQEEANGALGLSPECLQEPHPEGLPWGGPSGLSKARSHLVCLLSAGPLC